MSEEQVDIHRSKVRGQFLFSLFFVALAIILAVQLPYQTTWLGDMSLFVQPRFMPAIAVVGMLVFGCLHLWQLPRRRVVRNDWNEARIWVSGLEFVGWFMVYVYVVPIAGYLPSTIGFVWLMVFRMGYRSPNYRWFSVLFAVAVVVAFKALLQVRIPGASAYELMPSAIRNFLIVYL